ncbi:chemotaxis protein CheW [Burkholderiaceae bacterium DAT-1]|nr:chemotaxis protein CheW [Burkholderiaceae bacterium DAT-1]
MAKRISLREFQESVVARLKEMASTHSATSRLGVMIGQDRWLVDLTDVSEVIPVPTMVSVPLTHRWFKGVANVRGNLFSVVDLPAFLGGEQSTPASNSRLLLVHTRHITNAALLVNRMVGLRNLENLEHAGDADGELPWAGATWRDAQGEIWRELHLSELVTQPVFLQVGLV